MNRITQYFPPPKLTEPCPCCGDCVPLYKHEAEIEICADTFRAIGEKQERQRHAGDCRGYFAVGVVIGLGVGLWLSVAMKWVF